MEQSVKLEEKSEVPSSVAQENEIKSPLKQEPALPDESEKPQSPPKENSMQQDSVAVAESGNSDTTATETSSIKVEDAVESPKVGQAIDVDEPEKPSQDEIREEKVNEGGESEKKDSGDKVEENESDIKQEAVEEAQAEEQMILEEKDPEKVVAAVVENMELFKGFRYFVIQSDDSQVEKYLDSRGAKKDPYLSTFVSCVICDNLPDPESLSYESYSDAREVFDLTIVKVNILFFSIVSHKKRNLFIYLNQLKSDWVKKCLFVNSLLP
jgi:hypothetical protein